MRSMKHSRFSNWTRFLPGPLATQGIIAAIVMTAAMTPATGGAALYLPLMGNDKTTAISWSQAHHAELVGPGPYEGAFILRIPSGSLAVEALKQGALLISVPEFLCGSPKQ